MAAVMTPVAISDSCVRRPESWIHQKTPTQRGSTARTRMRMPIRTPAAPGPGSNPRPVEARLSSEKRFKVVVDNPKKKT